MQEKAWEREYRQRKLVTGSAEPQRVVMRYFRYLKKEKNVKLEGLKVLDLGSGTGRNSNYLARAWNDVTGLEISDTALKIARERAKNLGIKVEYIKQSIGGSLPFPDNAFDLILDITSSNSLDDAEREIYLKEAHRVLKSGGHFFVRALSKEGDKNAKNLLKLSPGKDKGTYYMPALDLYEKVFGENDFREIYGKYFQIEKIIKESGYAEVAGRKYKRRYLAVYMVK